MQEIVERIQKIMAEQHLTSAEFADRLGIGRPLLSHVLSGRNNPSLQLIIKIIEQYPSYSADWLIFGKAHNHIELPLDQSEVMNNKNFKKEPFGEQTLESNSEVKSIRKVHDASADQIIMLYSDLTFECYKLRK